MFRLLRDRSPDGDQVRPRGGGCPRTSVIGAKAQALVEFALVLVPLLFLLLAIIEGAFLFQSYLAIQHAAREATRFAITYQPPIKYGLDQVPALLRGERPPPLYPDETEPDWHLRRSGLVKDRAEEQSMGIRIMDVEKDEPEPPPADNGELPGFFGVYVRGQPRPGEPPEFQWDHPGGPGLPVQVHVHYKWIPLDPLLRAIVPRGVMLTGSAEMINEGIQWAEWTPTPMPPPPTPTVPEPTATVPPPPMEPTQTVTPTQTPTFTPTPTLTPTPNVPYLILAPERKKWPEADLPSGEVELHLHLPDGRYDVSWRDNCGRKTDLGLTISTQAGFGSADMPRPESVAPGFRYLCPPVEQGRTYTGKLSTELAEAEIDVYVPISPPDLTVARIDVPEDIQVGQAVTVGVVISNVGQGVVSGTFDVDIYVNPSNTPVLSGQLGQGTEGGSSPKQWYTEVMSPGASATLNYVVIIPAAGDHQIWAQVDTSDQVVESDEGNNILGPIELSLFCSDYCDDFDPGALDPKWTLSPIGAGPGSASPSVVGQGRLRIEGSGADVGAANDGKSFLLHQGAYGGSFEMSVQVLGYPRGTDGAKAGLMAHESGATGARYVALAVIDRGGAPYLQALVRERANAQPTAPCGAIPVPANRFDGSPGNGEGVWLRIDRDGQGFTMYSSLDGKSWQTQECMQHRFSPPVLADASLPGIWMAPQAPAARRAEYDRFRLCPLGASDGPPVRPKPPLLKECGNVLVNSDFEPSGDLAPWVVGTEPGAVQASADHSCDQDGQPGGGYSMLLRADSSCQGGPCHPWARQDFVVPRFISTTQPVDLELGVSLYFLVPPPSASPGRSEDQLRMVIQDGGGNNVTAPLVIASGANPDRGTFRAYARDMSGLLDWRARVGEQLRFRLEVPNPNGQGNSRFYVDQVRYDFCTIVQPPDPEPDKVERLGGRIQVILEGRPTQMAGIDVWAIQLPDGTTPPDQLEVYTTTSLHDSSYNFYNLNPGRYRIYAEVWVSGNLYSAATTITVQAGDVVTNINLNLL